MPCNIFHMICTALEVDRERSDRVYKLNAVREDFLFLEFDGRRWPTAANVWVIVDQDGLILIDTGLDREESFGGIAACIAAAGHAVGDIHTILLTHGHTDHIAGVRQFMKHVTPRILLSAKSLPIATNPDLQSEQILPRAVRRIVPELADYDVLNNFRQTCGDWLLAEADVTAIHDGDRLQLGVYCLEAIPVPGHEAGLMMFHEDDKGIMLTTDLLRNSGAGAALPWYSSSGGGVDRYLESLANVADYSVREAFPSHGGAINDYRAAVAETQSVIVGRQNEIEEQLSACPKTCRELDRHLYSARALELCPWYSSVTEAHLVKLENEGRLTRDGLHFSLTNTHHSKRPSTFGI